MRVYLGALLLLCGLITAAPVAAHPPYGLVVDAAGNAYFSDLETVWRLSPDGELSVFRPAVAQSHVHELALAPDGAIEGDQNHYDPAAQRFYTGLWRRTAAGSEQPVIPMTERPPPGAGVWQDRAGNRYTSQWLSNEDRRVALLRRRPDGRVEILYDEAGGASRPVQPSVASVGGMGFGPDGSIFFANGGVLRRLSNDGHVTRLYDGGRESSLRGIAAAPDGRVVAADMGRKKVLAVAADGTVSTLYREPAAWLPVAVALAGPRLLVLEANEDPYRREDRVRVIEVKDGRGMVIASPGQSQAVRAPPLPPAAEGRGPGAGLILLAGVTASAALFAAWRPRWRRGAEH